MTGRILVAGVGNVFLRDDAFGVEVVRVLAGRPATAQWFGRAADAELAAAAPLPDNAFKVTLARNVIVRMLCELAGAGS